MLSNDFPFGKKRGTREFCFSFVPLLNQQIRCRYRLWSTWKRFQSFLRKVLQSFQVRHEQRYCFRTVFLQDAACVSAFYQAKAASMMVPFCQLRYLSPNVRTRFGCWFYPVSLQCFLRISVCFDYFCLNTILFLHLMANQSSWLSAVTCRYKLYSVLVHTAISKRPVNRASSQIVFGDSFFSRIFFSVFLIRFCPESKKYLWYFFRLVSKLLNHPAVQLVV